MIAYNKLKESLGSTPYTWLITGVAGFIGSNLLENLLRLNQNVIGLDNFSTGFRENIDDVLSLVTPKQAAQFKFIQGDIRNLQDCKNAMIDVDYVLHQAALGSVPRSIVMPESTNETNISGFLNMLIAAKDAQVRRFVYASSSSVYGDSAVLPKIESAIGKPLSPYAVSKYSNELYASAFANCYGLETIGLRYFNIFGPRQSPTGPYAAVIPLWIMALLNNEPIYINGDGETTRDFCYIENAVQANFLAATVDNNKAINKVYNTSVGNQITLNQLYKTICSYLNLSPSAIYKDFRPGDIRHSLADISLSQKLLGYCPSDAVDVGLEKTIKWFCNNHTMAAV